MSTESRSPSAPRNRLLRLLPQADYQRLLPRLQPFKMDLKRILYRAHTSIDYVYFPEVGLASAMTVMDDGDAIEVATIGREGVVGLPALFADATSPNEVMVQVAGSAQRIEAKVLREEAEKSSRLYRILTLYHNAFLVQVSQSVACNGLHVVRQRCCRWLLMTHDRVEDDVVPLTHELLAIMLGVRRPSITEVLRPLQEEGLIEAGRGQITVLDRPGLEAAACECYRAVCDEFDRLLGDPDQAAS